MKKYIQPLVYAVIIISLLLLTDYALVMNGI